MHSIHKLVEFGIQHGLVEKIDRAYVTNRILDIMGLDAPPEMEAAETLPPTITPMLTEVTEEAVSRGLVEDTLTNRELFANRLAGAITPPPEVVRAKFRALYKAEGPRAATEWFYEMCRACDYIRVDAIAKNARFFAPSPAGELEITINLSKPEKDPRDIAAARAMKQTGYPKCMLCAENPGYAGRLDFPARNNHRIIPLSLDGGVWYLQYSPYLYYNEHAIVLNEKHVPMRICRATFERLFDFVEQFPHYFLGSNADLPIVGGSILSHDHFQGGNYTFPMDRAGAEIDLPDPAPGVKACVVNWPMTCIRLTGSDRKAMIDLADAMLRAWRAYSDETLQIFAETYAPHNTITPISQKQDGKYILDLVFRNNLTSAEFPLGIFHPHPCRHHIKRENIGLIEVMGLFILPGRLKNELAQTVCYLCGQEYDAAAVEPHKAWADEIRARRSFRSPEEAQAVLRNELAQLCMQLLGDAAVFKDTPEGNDAFARFIDCCAL
ncbi:MAG: UDP-glucose--hexose-1-phosphate uridylyltransferase [Clostridiales bacterium]|nr:UDP-glucose--hexose-1-phosphate uridylyltransferase [Clostridiales bacterium]